MEHAKTLVDSAKAEAANRLARLRELEARMLLEPEPPPRPRRVSGRPQRSLTHDLGCSGYGCCACGNFLVLMCIC